ncbi:MAG: hypothetical protein HY707_00990 [Ignavibacteriae bacterium]|nr:hypothetical protein [Ignavibacteriota bacterium]
MKRFLFTLLILNCCFAIKAYAHHGKKYLVTGSYDLPHQGSLYALFATDVQNNLGNKSYELEPGILYGLQGRWEIEFHMHHGIEDGEFHIEALALETRIGIFGEFSEHEDHYVENNSPFGVSLLVEYEKGLSDHPDNYEGRIIAGTEVGAYSIDANIIWQQAFDEERSHETRYAMGVKRTVSQAFGIGAELDGNFSSITSTKITPGIYFSANEQFDLKLGTSIGVSPSSDNTVVRLALVYGIQ